MVKVIYKNVKIKIFDLALSEKIAEEVFWGILPKISKRDKVSLGLNSDRVDNDDDNDACILTMHSNSPVSHV